MAVPTDNYQVIGRVIGRIFIYMMYFQMPAGMQADTTCKETVVEQVFFEFF
jgi:hypothetical protein